MIENDDEVFPQTDVPAETTNADAQSVVGIPTIAYYLKSYGKSLESNEKKAVGIFREYESKEKIRRLQTELNMIRMGKVSDQVCERTLGKKRQAKHNGFDRWAVAMLQWLTVTR